jgi:glycosyltransferase involved in cell wall biosynthesis
LRKVRPAGEPDAAVSRALAEQVQWSIIPQRRRGGSNTLFSIPHPGVDLDHHPLLKAADILHLHWTSWLTAPALLRRWQKAGRAVVWTLHDFWPMTGGCHYPDGCEQFRTMCMSCPQLLDEWSLVVNGFEEKRRGWAGVPLIVAPSAWMAAQARASAIFGACRIEIIPNPIETDTFAPREDRPALRATLGLGPDDLLIVAGAYDNRERRKGGDILLSALERIMQDGSLRAALRPDARMVVASIGKSSIVKPSGFELLDLGEVEDDAALADILAAADAACIPSREDNYPNLALEAMACGTPCVATPVGGLPDLVRDGTTGVLAAEAQAEAFANALLRFASRHRGDPGMRNACRAQVEKENTPVRIGERLASAYSEIAPRSRAMPTSASAHRRIAAALSHAPVAEASRPSPAFLRFPTNLLLQNLAGQAAAGLHPAELDDEDGRPRLLALQARHAHHGAYAGPAQFLRHLPPALRVEAMSTPLGKEMAGDRAADFQAWSRLLSATPFGQQGNAWLAEAELAALSAHAPPDIIHAIDGEYALQLIARLPRRFFADQRRPRLVATLHQPPQKLANMAAPPFLARLDAVVVLCEAQRAALRHHVTEARLHLIPHGIDTDFFTPGPARSGERGIVRLLTVGHWLRDLETGLAAFGMLRHAGLQAVLRLVTPEPPLRVPDGVIVECGLSDEELRQAYRDADAVLLPLLDATANNALLEAMACGRPVIATDVGGVAETARGAVRLAPPRDPIALAKAVLDLAEQPGTAAALGSVARARAETLDWRVAANRHAALYESLSGAEPCPA